MNNIRDSDTNEGFSNFNTKDTSSEDTSSEDSNLSEMNETNDFNELSLELKIPDMKEFSGIAKFYLLEYDTIIVKCISDNLFSKDISLQALNTIESILENEKEKLGL